jgi:hypothetical protein
MQKYMEDENLMPKEEKGCRRGSKGCKDKLLTSKAIQECKCKKKNLCMAGIVYQTAFDRVPYSWIINPLNAELNPICHLLALLGDHHIFHVSRIRVESLEIIGINTKVISFTKVMGYWRTRMRLHAEYKLKETEDIKIQCGITVTSAILYLPTPSQ